MVLLEKKNINPNLRYQRKNCRAYKYCLTYRVYNHLIKDYARTSTRYEYEFTFGNIIGDSILQLNTKEVIE